MKTIALTILFCACHSLLIAQLQVSENDSKEKRNSLTLDAHSNTGIGIKYDRELIKKKKYSLVGQAGIAEYSLFNQSVNSPVYLYFNAALYNRFTFGQHSIEAGLGVNTVYAFYPNLAENTHADNRWGAAPYVHLGYMFQPRGKNWFLRANLQLTRNFNTPSNKSLFPGMGLGLGFKF